MTKCMMGSIRNFEEAIEKCIAAGGDFDSKL
jgi:hypothetical protein